MFFEQGDFFSQAGATPSEIQRKREKIQAMMGQYGNANYVGEGIADMFTGIMNGVAAHKLNKEERTKRKETDDLFASVMGGAPTYATESNLSGKISGNVAAPQQPQAAPTGGNAQAIRQGLIDRGLPEHVADGFIMNFQDESGMNPGINEKNPIVPGSRGGFGLYQLTGPRRVAYEKFAASRGVDPSNVDAQLDFLMTELQGPESRAAKSIFSAKDAGSAAAAIVSDFLRPAEEHRARRVAEYTGGGAPVMADAMPAYNGPSAGDLRKLQANPWLTPDQRAAIEGQIKLAEQASDPMRALQMQQAQQNLQRGAMEMQQMQNPQAPKGVVVGGNIVDPTTGRVIYEGQQGGAVGTEYGLSPQYGIDEQGNPVMIQVGKNGTATQTAMPEGVQFQKEPIKLDAGTHFVLLDPITRQPVGQVEKNVEGAAAAQSRGSASGKIDAEKQAMAPEVIARATNTVDLIDSIINDPNLPGITGKYQGRMDPEGLSGMFMSQDAVDLSVKTEQLKGKAFLEAFESLKGGGQITEREGTAAQNAIARLQRVQSEEAFTQSLQELRIIADNARRRAMGEDVPEFTGEQPAQPSSAGFGNMGLEQIQDYMTQNPNMSQAEKDALRTRLQQLAGGN